MNHFEPFNNLRRWKVSPALERWLERIQFGFLAEISRINFEIKMDRSLIRILVSGYDKDSKCFKFNEIPFYFSLVDVYMLTGMPVSGDPVLGHIDDSFELFNKAFPSYKLDHSARDSTKMIKGKIRTTWLHDTFANMELDDENNALWDEYRRAFILSSISAYILPDASSGVVELEYATLMDDLGAVGKYAWGAAAWANMHHQLQNGNLKGLVYALLLFMILRVPSLRALLTDQEPRMDDKFPLILSWFERLQHGLNQSICQNAGKYRLLLDNLVLDQVVLQPYKKYPPGCREQLKLACSKTYCMNRVVVAIHEPDYVPAQFGFVTVDESSAPELRIDFTYPKKGPKKKRDLNNDNKYEIYRNGWHNRTPLRGHVCDDLELQPWMEGWVDNQAEGMSKQEPLVPEEHVHINKVKEEVFNFSENEQQLEHREHQSVSKQEPLFPEEHVHINEVKVEVFNFSANEQQMEHREQQSGAKREQSSEFIVSKQEPLVPEEHVHINEVKEEVFNFSENEQQMEHREHQSGPEHVSRNHAEQPEDSMVRDNFREQLNKRPIEESCDSITSELPQLVGLEDRIWRLEKISNEIKRAKLNGTSGGNSEM